MMKENPKVISSIFSINTGRSGSGYLAKILGTATNCESYHEAQPDGFGEPLRSFSNGDRSAMVEIAIKKKEQIRQANTQRKVYAETNHCFVKGFGWPLMEIIDPETVGVIILRRNPKEIADSIMRLGTSPLSIPGQKFYLTPKHKKSEVSPPSFWGLPDELGFEAAKKMIRILYKFNKLGVGENYPRRAFAKYQRALTDWYISETAALERRFRKTYPQCAYFEICIDDLNNAEHVQRLFDFFELKCTASKVPFLGVRANEKK